MWFLDLWERHPEKAMNVTGVIVTFIIGVIVIGVFLWLLHLVWLAIVLLIYALLQSFNLVWLWLLGLIEDSKSWCDANQDPLIQLRIVIGVTIVVVLMWLLGLCQIQSEKQMKVVGVIVGDIVGVIVLGLLIQLLNLVWLCLLLLIEDLKTWCTTNQELLIALGTVVGVQMWLLEIFVGVIVSADGVSLWLLHSREKQEHTIQYDPTINSRQVGSYYRRGTRQEQKIWSQTTINFRRVGSD